jgi:Cache domain
MITETQPILKTASRSLRPMVLRLVAVPAFVFGVAAIVLSLSYVLNRGEALDDAKNSARQIALKQAGMIGARLQTLTPVIDRIASDLSSGILKPEDAAERLKHTVEENPDLFEAGIAYQPNAWKPGIRLFAPHAARHGTDVDQFQLEQRYDYTSYPWFKDGIAAGGPHWGEPYFGGATKTLVVPYSAPFYRSDDPGKPPIGVVRGSLALDRIQQFVSNLSLGETGYAFLLSRKGVYLSHPVPDFVRDRRTIFDVARENGDKGRERLGNEALAGRRGEEEATSGVTGQATWMFTEPIPTSGWSIGTVFMKSEMLLDPKILRRSLTRIECCLMMFLLLASALWFCRREPTNRDLWCIAVTASAILVAGISAVWWMTLHYPDRNGASGVHIYSSADLQQFLSMNAKSAGNVNPPEQIKTGIFIRTMRFGAANDVMLAGTIWQRFDARNKDFTPGVIIANAETLETREAYHTTSDDQDVIGWDFKATLREPFEGSAKFPFDRAIIRVRMVPKAFYKNVVLTPDLDSYQLLIPSSLPGGDKLLVLPGWDLIASYFSYSPFTGATSFGVGAPLERAKSQELRFTVIAQRSFLDPFVSSVLPIIVVAALLFGMLVVVSKKSPKIEATGFKGGDVLRASVTLVFPVLVAQVNLRNKIGSSNVIYIEYFYFVLYAAILAVSANSLFFTLKDQGLVHYRDNLIAKLIFWPALLSAFFIVTLVFLY